MPREATFPADSPVVCARYPSSHVLSAVPVMRYLDAAPAVAKRLRGALSWYGICARSTGRRVLASVCPPVTQRDRPFHAPAFRPFVYAHLPRAGDPWTLWPRRRQKPSRKLRVLPPGLSPPKTGTRRPSSFPLRVFQSRPGTGRGRETTADGIRHCRRARGTHEDEDSGSLWVAQKPTC